MKKQSAFYRTMSCLKYLSSGPTLHINGTYLGTYVDDGGKLSLRRHSVSISEFAALKVVSGGILLSGRRFLSLFITAPRDQEEMATLLLHSSTWIVYVVSSFT